MRRFGNRKRTRADKRAAAVQLAVMARALPPVEQLAELVGRKEAERIHAAEAERRGLES